MIDTRPLRWGLALVLGCSLLCGSALANTAHDDHASHGKAKSGKGAPVETEVQRLVHRYDSAQVVVVKQQLCLRAIGCVTDEGRLLDAMETVRVVLQTLAERARLATPMRLMSAGCCP